MKVLVTLHVSVWVEIDIGCDCCNYTSWSRSTWACELKWGFKICCKKENRSRSTWACELKYKVHKCRYKQKSSRSTWACELKFLGLTTGGLKCGHAPRERVSWNIFILVSIYNLHSHAPRERVSWNCKLADNTNSNAVTLHVSVWVEMLTIPKTTSFAMVTLHVSVWVEMVLSICIAFLKVSRSTWACELKSAASATGEALPQSRSTWACELKYFFGHKHYSSRCHAPRERVSWNFPLQFLLYRLCTSRSTLEYG